MLMNNNYANKDITLSVIVPVYNVEKYIEECIKSIINQSLKNIEIIVVNDGSTDKSIDIVNEINDHRIIIINKENGGLSSARNVGIKNAKGKYIAFVDSDDFINDNNAYKNMIYIAETSNTHIVSGKAIKYYDDNKKITLESYNELFKEEKITSDKFILKSLEKRRIYVPVWLNIYNRQWIISNGLFFKEGIVNEDELFTHKALLRTKYIGLYNKEFYSYRQREGSITNSINSKRGNDMINVCLELQYEFEKIDNSFLRKELLRYIAFYSFLAIDDYGADNIPLQIKKLIICNIEGISMKIRSLLLIINKKIYKYVDQNLNKILQRS